MTTPYNFGDVVLLPFPFTDQSGAKKRPAVVVSSRAYHEARNDVVIMALTSRVRTPFTLGEALVSDWEAAGLVKPTMFKPVFATIEQSLILRRMGALSEADLRALREVLGTVVG